MVHQINENLLCFLTAVTIFTTSDLDEYSNMLVITYFTVSVMSEPDDVHRTEPVVKDSSRMSLHTPTFNIDAYIKQTVNSLPQTMDRIIQLRYVVGTRTILGIVKTAHI